MKQKYPNIFSPLRIGDVVFKNRIWSAPAGTHLLAGSEEYPNDAVIAYYANKARGGSANITFSAQNMDIYRGDDPEHASENIFNRSTHKYWHQLTDAIHFYGSKASLELLAFAHHGYNYKGDLVNYTVNGGIGPGGTKTFILTRQVMEQIADLYAEAAECALACGFDMILIHGGHGLILSQFLSPLFNTRADEFGGSLENRMRFPMMVLEAIRNRVGRKILIEYRISGSELAGNRGFTVEDCIKVLKVMQEKIDIAHISAGSFFNDTEHITHPTYFLPAGTNTYLARAVKACPDIHIPVLTLGGFQNPQLIEETLANGEADIVAMARGSIAEPHMVSKTWEDRSDEIIPCIKCFHCLDYTRADTFACSVNPTVGRESRLPCLIPPIKNKKKVVVIGGGPAGMEAAITAAGRGHAVTLLEQEAKLGGKLRFSRKAEFKSDLCRFMDYQINMVNKLDIDIHLNTKVTQELISSFEPEAVIAALGAEPVMPSIPGVDGKNIVYAEACYDMSPEELGDDIVVIGGGLVGCETALYLSEVMGKHVILIEMLPVIAKEEFHLTRTALMERMDKSVEYHVNTCVTGITSNGLTFMAGGRNKRKLEADTVVIAAGMSPRQNEVESMRSSGYIFTPVGDCVIAKNVRTSTRSGFDAAMSL